MRKFVLDSFRLLRGASRFPNTELQFSNISSSKLGCEPCASIALATSSIAGASPWHSYYYRPVSTSDTKHDAEATSSSNYASQNSFVSDGSEGTLSNPLYAEQIRPGKPISCYGEGRAGTKIRKIPMSQKKINYFAKLIRRMHVDDALAQCKLQPKKAGRILGEGIKAAMANASHNHGLDPKKLVIDIINTGRGTKKGWKRMWPRAKGRSNIRVVAQSFAEIIVKESDDGPKMKYRKPLLERPRRFRDAYVDHATALSRDKLEWQQSVPI